MTNTASNIQPPTLDLTGQRAVVTGAAGQLGRVMARTLAACGADIAIHYHTSREMADQLVAEVNAMGRDAIAVSADIGAREAVFAMRDTIFDKLGPIDIVVTNAVGAHDWAPILELDEKHYESQFKSSIMQNVLMAKAFAPSMIERGTGGRFIGISTECTIQCAPTQSAYVAGKRGMDGVLRVLAREIGRHAITVNQVAPGWTISDNVRKDGTESQPAYEANVPLGRRGTDQDIANAVAFLASDLAGFITGAFIPVCGGNVMVSI